MAAPAFYCRSESVSRIRIYNGRRSSELKKATTFVATFTIDNIILVFGINISIVGKRYDGYLYFIDAVLFYGSDGEGDIFFGYGFADGR